MRLLHAGIYHSVKALLDRTTKPTAEDIEEAVSGNICRCTGYNKIVDAIISPPIASQGA